MDNSDKNLPDMQNSDLHIEDEKLYDDLETACFLDLKNHRTLANWRCCKRHPELTYLKIGNLVRQP